MTERIQLRVLLDSQIPVYRQLVDQLRAMFVEGRLKAEDPLPSVRSLAGDLGVHFNTVAEAYRALADEGWLEIKQGRSVRILDRRVPKLSAATAQPQVSRLRHLVAELLSLGLAPERIRREVDAALHANGGNR